MGTELVLSADMGAKQNKLTEDDPLGNALKALRGNDPLVETAQRQIWRKLWVRDTINDWIAKLVAEPKFFVALHKAMPDDIELLLEIKVFASSAAQSLPAICIVGLVNERLERYQSKNNYLRCGSSMSEEFTTLSTPKYRTGFAGITDRVNFNGYVCAGVQKRDGTWAAGTMELPKDTALLPAKTACRLVLWLQPDQPSDSWADTILIETGQDADLVSFCFEVDCATLHLPYGQKRVRFHRREKSGEVFFDFVTPLRAGEHVIFVHVFQGSSLVKTLEVILMVDSKR